MVFRDVATDDLDTVGSTDFPYQISHASTERSGQYRLLVLRCPHEMVFKVKGGVGGLAIQFHVGKYIILKGPPEGGGFAPKDG